MKIINNLAEWLYPSTCLFCANTCEPTQDLCFACKQELPWIKTACRQCGLPLDHEAPYCGECLISPPPFQYTIAAFHYAEPIAKIILNLKFSNKLAYAKWLAQLLLEKIQNSYLTEKLPDIIIPVPLHLKRLQERGYNQALEIAKTLAKKLSLPMNRTLCQRIRATAMQSELPAEKRRANVKNAFELNKPLAYEHIALVDDVMTTGQTVREISQLLLKHGAKRVDVWCVARTNKNL